MPSICSAVRTLTSSVERMGAAQRAMHIFGSTDMLRLLQNAVVAPAELNDIGRMPLRSVTRELRGAGIGALARMADVAADQLVARRYSALAEAPRETASPHARNMATLWWKPVTGSCRKSYSSNLA